MANTAVSSQPLTLNLDSQDGAEYVKFIRSLINKFPECSVEKNHRNLDEDVADKELKSKIEECFPEPFHTHAPFMKSVPQTYRGEELQNWLFQVRLMHSGRNLDILINKNDLYLVGYKGKFKEENGTVGEYWIVLKGKNHDKVGESVKEFLPSNQLKPVQLSTSYTALFCKFDPSSFKVSAAEPDDQSEKIEEKSGKIEEKSETVRARKKRDEDRNINDATRKLNGIKDRIESLREALEDKVYAALKERVTELLDMVPREFTIEEAREQLKGDDNKAGLDFLTYLKLPRKGISEGKLIKHIERSVDVDDDVIAVKKCLGVVKLNRLAFTDAVDYLTQYTFNEKEGETASHIIKLAVMICEAARFGSIKQHVESNYHRETHDSTDSLPAECIASIYNWKDRSIFLQRGGTYGGEQRLRGEDPTVIMEVKVTLTLTE